MTSPERNHTRRSDRREVHGGPIAGLAALILAVLACGLSGGSAVSEPQTSPSSSGAVEPSNTPAPDSAAHSPMPEPGSTLLWTCQRCSGDTVWELNDQVAGEVKLPVSLGQYYDYSTSGEAILYASHFADSGAGPADIAVSDLWVLDVPSGESSQLVADDIVVEALWLPSGDRVAYIEALPHTYQLVVYELNGQKTILAQNIAFTWSVSPGGDWIAFSRESRYGLPGEPGLYSVQISTGQEHKLSDLDRAGTGSIDDRPYWSLDGRWVLFPVLSGMTSAMDLSRPDGSQSFTLSFDEALANLLWYDQPVSSALWLPGATQFLGQARVSGGEQMGGPDRLVLYELNPTRTSIIQAREMGEANALIAWHEPGKSVWILSPEGDRPILFSLP